MRTTAIINETRVTFKQGTRLLAGGEERGPSYKSLWRYATEGRKSKSEPDGPPITLEYCYIGGRIFTSVEAYERWLSKIN